MMAPRSVKCLKTLDGDCYAALADGTDKYLNPDRRLRGGQRDLISCTSCKTIYGQNFCIFYGFCNTRRELGSNDGHQLFGGEEEDDSSDDSEDNEDREDDFLDDGCWENISLPKDAKFATAVQETLSGDFEEVRQLSFEVQVCIC